jgi:hypothetical protein
MSWIPYAIQGAGTLMQMLNKNKGGGSGGFQAEGGSPFQYLNQIPGTLESHSQEYGQMIKDPGAVMSKAGEGFQQSPGYQFTLQQALSAGNQASAAGGMVGSPQNQLQSQTTATGLANQDYYNYLNHALNIYGEGVKGYSNLGENLSRNLMSESQLAENERMMQQRSEEQESSDKDGLFGSLTGSLSGIAGSLFSKGGGSS